MTNEEAIKLIKKHGMTFMANKETKDALEHAVDVLEKQTPKMNEEIHPRVIIESQDGEYTTHRGLTLKELKVEAHRQGYTLARYSTHFYRLPCTCGHKASLWYSKPYYLVRCSHCDNKSEIATSDSQAWTNWNYEVNKWTKI